MIIGSDFDGVIADTYSLLSEEVSLDAIMRGDIDFANIRPLSGRMLDMLKNNRISVIITARDLIAPVYRWMSHHAPEYRGAIESCKDWDDSKANACMAYGIEVFIDDDPGWIEEVSNAGILALHFDRAIHGDSYRLLNETTRRYARQK